MERACRAVIAFVCPVIDGPRWAHATESWTRHVPGIEIVPIEKDDLRSYWREIEKRWGLDDLMFVEHDVMLHGGEAETFEQCPELWCGFPVNGNNWGFGCTRYRLSFQRQVTLNAICAYPSYCDFCEGVDSTCWMHIDGKLIHTARPMGFRYHEHYPQVGHRNFPGGEMVLTAHAGNGY